MDPEVTRGDRSFLSAHGDVFDLRYFKAVQSFPDNYSAHNVALKWLRQNHDGTKGFYLPLWIEVGKIKHFRGESYTFCPDTEPWSWTQMIAAFDDESMKIVVTGDDGRSRGVVSCEFAPRANSYDDISSRALRKAGMPVRNLLRV